MLKQKNYLICLMCFAALILAGCMPYGSSVRSSSVGQVRPLEGKPSLIKRLALDDVQVVEQGEHLRIIIPADFFNIEKSKLRMSKEPALERVAKLVLLYRNAPVFVQGFSNNIENEASNMERTTEQANDVAAVLWSYGVDQRRLRVKGYGSKFPIADNRTVEGRWYNRRVEIKI